MVVESEAEFGIEFDDEALLLTSFTDLNSFIAYISGKISEASI
jgi:acyl carrier protein